jgi:hypothetical protein
VRGPLFDRTIALRFDVPLFVEFPELAVDAHEHQGFDAPQALKFRWSVSLTDLW